MRYLGVFRVERCSTWGTACRAQGTTVGRWAVIDPRDKSHAAHADTKAKAKVSARLFRRARENAIRQEQGVRP